MMPLTMAQPGEWNRIKRVGGRPETRQFLENLGFVAGGEVSVITRTGGGGQRRPRGNQQRHGRKDHGLA